MSDSKIKLEPTPRTTNTSTVSEFLARQKEQRELMSDIKPEPYPHDWEDKQAQRRLEAHVGKLLLSTTKLGLDLHFYEFITHNLFENATNNCFSYTLHGLLCGNSTCTWCRPYYDAEDMKSNIRETLEKEQAKLNELLSSYRDEYLSAQPIQNTQ